MEFDAPGDNFNEYPVVQGNQQSMQFAFLFNRVGRPDLAQKWTHAIWTDITATESPTPGWATKTRAR